MPSDARTRHAVLTGAVSAGVVLLIGLAAHVVAGAQVLLHLVADLSGEHLHHDGPVEAARCLLQEPAMLLAHAAAVVPTVLVLLLLEPLLEPGSRMPGPLGATALPRHRHVTAVGPALPVVRSVFADHAPRRGPPEVHAPA